MKRPTLKGLELRISQLEQAVVALVNEDARLDRRLDHIESILHLPVDAPERAGSTGYAERAKKAHEKTIEPSPDDPPSLLP